MNESKKMQIVVLVLGLIAILLIALSIIENKKQAKSLEKFNQYFSSETEKLIYFGRETCHYCVLLEPAKKQLLDDANVDYYYIDTDKINNKTLDEILDKLKLSSFGTPTLVIVKNNEIIYKQEGVFSSETDNISELKQFLTKYNIIKEN